jgi:hypothetical protein
MKLHQRDLTITIREYSRSRVRPPWNFGLFFFYSYVYVVKNKLIAMKFLYDFLRNSVSKGTNL